MVKTVVELKESFRTICYEPITDLKQESHGFRKTGCQKLLKNKLVDNMTLKFQQKHQAG